MLKMKHVQRIDDAAGIAEMIMHDGRTKCGIICYKMNNECEDSSSYGNANRGRECSLSCGLKLVDEQCEQ